MLTYAEPTYADVCVGQDQRSIVSPMVHFGRKNCHTPVTPTPSHPLRLSRVFVDMLDIILTIKQFKGLVLHSAIGRSQRRRHDSVAVSFLAVYDNQINEIMKVKL